MNSVRMTAAQRKEVEECLDNFKRSILDALDGGQVVTLHIHHESQPVSDSPFGPVTDLRCTGWTFGASIGDYPRATP